MHAAQSCQSLPVAPSVPPNRQVSPRVHSAQREARNQIELDFAITAYLVRPCICWAIKHDSAQVFALGGPLSQHIPFTRHPPRPCRALGDFVDPFASSTLQFPARVDTCGSHRKSPTILGLCFRQPFANAGQDGPCERGAGLTKGGCVLLGQCRGDEGALAQPG